MTKIPPQNPHQGKSTQELLESTAWNSEKTAEFLRRKDKRETISFWLHATIMVITIAWLVWLLIYLPTMIEVITEKMMESMGPMLMGGGNGGLGAQVDPENIQKIMESLDLGAILGGGKQQ